MKLTIEDHQLEDLFGERKDDRSDDIMEEPRGPFIVFMATLLTGVQPDISITMVRFYPEI